MRGHLSTKFIVGLLCAAALVSGCSIQVTGSVAPVKGGSGTAATATPTAAPSATATPGATATPTPTPAPTATATPTATPTPTPVPPTITVNLNNTATAIQLVSQQSATGSLYYAVYDADQSTLTSAQIKTASSASISGALVARGVVTVGAANTNITTNITGLADRKRYTVYVSGESGAGALVADANVKKFSSVIPTWQSTQTYNTAVSGKGGIEMRYTIHMPQNYYNTMTNWPLLIYIHGGEGTFTSATNADFTSQFKTFGLVGRVASGVDDYPMIQATVQCNASFWSCTNQSEPSLNNEFITQLKNTYRVNAKRVYIIGMSWGGSGTWNFVKAYPTVPAAAIAVSGSNAYSATTLCNTIGANNVPFWSMINVNDRIFTSTSSSTGITNIQNCSGYTAEARYVPISGTTYPATVDNHMTFEYTFNTPYYNFGTGKFNYWNGTAGVLDTDPPTHRVPLAPEVVSALQDSSTYNGVTLNSLVDWLLLHEKP